MTSLYCHIQVCQDCLFVLANGVESDEQATAAVAMTQEWEGYDLAPDCVEDCDGGFSTVPCEGCNSPLGGNRHRVAVFKRAFDTL